MNIPQLVWLRRDLRLHDHHALKIALDSGELTALVFIFDPLILNLLTNKHDRRLTFIIESLEEIEKKLNDYGSSLIIRIGNPIEVWPVLVEEFQTKKVFFNRDYEPYAKKRDDEVTKLLKKKNVQVENYKDHVFFEKHEVLSQSREIYKVFTPYKNKWLEIFKAQDSHIPEYKTNLKNLFITKPLNTLLKNDLHLELGFVRMQDNLLKGGTSHALKRLQEFKDDIDQYDEWRNIPALNKTSNLSVYIRHGNLSVRDMLRLPHSILSKQKNDGANVWMSEIIWRDFYQMILDVYPKVEKSCFKPQYDNVKWVNNKEHFKAWCEGNTGYPIVDSAMRCLNETGMMNNRLRMVVASFLCKTLLIDWRWGEKYFAEKLLDFDLAANNGGWQWSASTGVDAQPYFRIFNPYSQSEKFDPDGEFIKTWCIELSHFDKKTIHSPHDTDFVEQAKAQCVIGKDYPHPIVAYKIQREKALTMYKSAVKEEN